MNSVIPRSLRASILLACLSAGATGPAMASNGALVDLLGLLRDKGTLTAAEYDMLVAAAKADQATVATTAAPAAAGSAAVASAATPAPSAAAGAAPAPTTVAAADEVKAVSERLDRLAWLEKVRLKGDLRTRYEYKKDEGQIARSRGRFRYRLGVIANPVERVEVGAGLASGTRDQRSTNQSFDDTFSGKDLNLDYAYMQYSAANGINAIAGKFSFKNYLWTPTDIMWDTDLNPEGMSLSWSGQNALGTMFVQGGVWVLEENSRSSDDPFMVYGQVGQGWTMGGWKGTAAVAGYAFMDANYISDYSRYDGRNTDSKLSSVNLALDLAHELGGGTVDLIGEYIKNVETNTSTDTAWALGAKYALGRWKAKYVYADVELNAVPDFLPDSDRDNGFPGERGHEFEISYDLMKNVNVALDYYHIKDDITRRDEDLLQADLQVKF
ncbi:MAG: putative porin [Gammaproteobacteria bacterium]|nr:putative porin [Gammaproteobacteria bacterium]MCP5200370.1 putative porin [Gammaproteobacteria bacterium]